MTGSSCGAVQHNLRAIGHEWICDSSVGKLETDLVQIGADGGPNMKLQLPPALGDEAYTREKLSPGVLVYYTLPAWYAEALRYASPLRVGLLHSVNQNECVIDPMSEEKLLAYMAQPFPDYRCEASAITMPKNLLLSAGAPEIQLFTALPFCVYAALALPIPFQLIQVMVDGAPVKHEEQTTLLSNALFRKGQNSDTLVNQAARSADLVLSRVSLLVDGSMAVPLFVPLSQCPET